MRSLPMLLMSMLIGMSTQRLESVMDRVKGSLARTQLKSIGKIIKIDALDGSSIEGLHGAAFSEYLKHNMEGGRAGAHVDPWGRPYVATYKKGNLYIFSVGPDGQINSQDDVRETIPVQYSY